MDKDPAFLELLKYPPILSVAQAMMGPLVCLRSLSARVTFPGAERQETPLHQHLRVVSRPMPPWFSAPHSLHALIYLDDLSEATGLVSLVLWHRTHGSIANLQTRMNPLTAKSNCTSRPVA